MGKLMDRFIAWVVKKRKRKRRKDKISEIEKNTQREK